MRSNTPKSRIYAHILTQTLRTSLHDSNTTSSEPVLTAHPFPSCFYTEGLDNPDYPGSSSTAAFTLYGSAAISRRRLAQPSRVRTTLLRPRRIARRHECSIFLSSPYTDLAIELEAEGGQLQVVVLLARRLLCPLLLIRRCFVVTYCTHPINYAKVSRCLDIFTQKVSELLRSLTLTLHRTSRRHAAINLLSSLCSHTIALDGKYCPMCIQTCLPSVYSCHILAFGLDHRSQVVVIVL
ncbi:hypothetical protein C8R45DRAFT_1090675 [Mycena sanguinolenta]|nr:hypothetical protein C8R45DRAFT_1090675 [Mycena sanguinolenta]